MMRAQILGAEVLVQALQRITPALQHELHTSIGQLVVRLQRLVMESKLSGQVLHVRTGRLRRSIQERTTASDNAVEGCVLTQVQYARGHEYGFGGAMHVREHLRMTKKAFGKQLKQPRAVHVRAYARHVKKRLDLRTPSRSTSARHLPSIFLK